MKLNVFDDLEQVDKDQTMSDDDRTDGYVERGLRNHKIVS